MKLTFTGGRELEKTLKDLGGKIASRLGDNAVRAGVRVVQKAAKSNAPVETGRLRNSLKVKAPRNKSSGVAVAEVVTGVFYAHMLEYGTVKMSPKPFMRPALDESAQAAIDKMADNLRTGIDRELKKQSIPTESVDQ